MSGRAISRLALIALLAGTVVAHADEIRLKDGTKIIGTIVGFENDSFRVETSYGFALIQKDKVADINISAPKKESEPKAKTSPPVTPPPAAAPAVVPATAKESPPSANEPVSVKASATEGQPANGNALPAVSKNETAVLKVKAVPEAPAIPAAPAPAPAPAPPVIRDEVRGNLYVNLTYGFQMFKPPSWELITGASKALPNAVAALGTDDETTMLVIGRERTKDSLEAHAAATEKALSEIYENYRLISSRRTTIAQLPAIERRFRGTADDHDWSVTLLTFAHGDDVFTLMGMTWADSDLIQVEENVIAKAANSLTFVPQ